MKAPPALAVTATITWGLLGLLSIPLLVISPMLFDSGESQILWVFFWSVVAFPFTCFLAVVASWIVWIPSRLDNPSRGRWLRIVCVLLPLVPGVAAIAALAVIELRCGGALACH